MFKRTFICATFHLSNTQKLSSLRASNFCTSPVYPGIHERKKNAPPRPFFFPLPDANRGANFNFTHIKIQHSSVLLSWQGEGEAEWGREMRGCCWLRDKKRWIASRNREGVGVEGGWLERSVGISRKAISSSWVVAARKTCPSSAVTLS